MPAYFVNRRILLGSLPLVLCLESEAQVMELVEGGELFDHIVQIGSFTEPVARYAAKQQGAQFAHSWQDGAASGTPHVNARLTTGIHPDSRRLEVHSFPAYCLPRPQAREYSCRPYAALKFLRVR